MNESVRNRIIAITLAGAALTGLSAGCLAWFVTCDWFHDHGPYDKDTWGGFTLAQLVGLLIFTFAAPTAFTFLFVGLQQTSRHAADVSRGQHGLVVAIGAAVLITLAVLGGIWSSEFLACMGFACYGATLLAAVDLSDNTQSVYGFKVTIGLALFFVGLLLAIVIIAAYVRAWKTARTGVASAPIEEAASLIGSTDGNGNSSKDKQPIVRPYMHTHTAGAWLWAGYFLYAGLLLAWWLLPTSIIPSSWEFWKPSRIAYNAYHQLTTDVSGCGGQPPRFCAELSGAPLTSINIAVNDYLNLKIFPSSIIFFTWLLVVPLLSIVILQFHTLRRIFSKKVSMFGSLFSLGELAFFSLFVLLITLWLYYWIGSHNFHGRSSTVSEKEVIFRTMGQLAVLVMALLLIPAARSSLVASFFRVSWEAAIQYHRWLGTLWILCVLAHIIAYFVFLQSEGTLAANWFPLHYSGSIDNFTVPHMEVITIFAIIVLLVTAVWERTRRKHFEWFYYSHLLTYAVLVMSVLWHAAAAWMYLLPAVTVWFADRMVRAYRSARAVRILELRARDCGHAGQITEIHCEVATGFDYKPGQYAFLNIAELSILEWHPFTIGGASENRLVFLVKTMGPDSWSQRLYDLAEKQSTSGVTCTLSIDGPEGVPHDYSRYESVILVACGIGITPVGSLWASLRAHRVPNRSVHMLWVARDRSLFQLLADSFENVKVPPIVVEGSSSSSSSRQDSAQLFYSPPKRRDGKDGTSEEKEEPTVSSSSTQRSLTSITSSGRPDWNERLPPLASRDPSRTMVFVCGPLEASQQIEVLANKMGWDFHTETFEL